MRKIKTYKHNDILKKSLKDPKFRKEYEKLEEEFKLAEEIILLRLKLKITQKDLAKRAKTSQPAISRLESGEYQNLSLSFLRKVGKVLGVEPKIRFKDIKLAS